MQLRFKFFYVFLIAAFFAKTIFAEDAPIKEAIESANQKIKKYATGTCSYCSSYPTAGEELLLKLRKTSNMPKACNHLVSSTGRLGSTGKSIFKILSEPLYKKYFTKANALGAFCPKFNSLNDSQKLMAWTWFWSSLAKEEASCNTSIIHGTTYRTKGGQLRVLNPREGYGLWALERDRNYRAWRGQACNNIGSPEGQARCAIDIMMKTQLSKGRSAAASMSYWGPVRRGTTQIIPHMRRLSLCF